jgi:hypothetical protein
MTLEEGMEIIGFIENVIIDDDGIHMIVSEEGKRIIVTGKDYDNGDYSHGNLADIKIKYVGNIAGEWKFGGSGILPLYIAEKIKARRPYVEIKKVDLDRVKIIITGIEETVLISDLDKFVKRFDGDKDAMEELKILTDSFEQIYPLWKFIGDWRFGIATKPSKERLDQIKDMWKE